MQPGREVSLLSKQSSLRYCWMIRPDVSFKMEGRTAIVRDKDDIVGELELTRDHESILPLLVSSSIETCEQNELIQRLISLGYAKKSVIQLLETLLHAGLAVQFASKTDIRVVKQISHWTSKIDECVKRIQESCILIITPADLPPKLLPALVLWGGHFEEISDFSALEFSPSINTTKKPSLIIAAGTLQIENRSLIHFCIENRIPLLPIRSEGTETLIGPIFIEDTSPCPHCLEGEPLHLSRAEEIPAVSSSTSPWDLIAEYIANFLANRPAFEAPFLRHRVDNDDHYLGSQSLLIDPRCQCCSRLNRFPENATIHG